MPIWYGDIMLFFDLPQWFEANADDCFHFRWKCSDRSLAITSKAVLSASSTVSILPANRGYPCQGARSSEKQQRQRLEQETQLSGCWPTWTTTTRLRTSLGLREAPTAATSLWMRSDNHNNDNVYKCMKWVYWSIFRRTSQRASCGSLTSYIMMRSNLSWGKYPHHYIHNISMKYPDVLPLHNISIKYPYLLPLYNISISCTRYFYRECCRSKEGLWYIWVYLLQVFMIMMMTMMMMLLMMILMLLVLILIMAVKSPLAHKYSNFADLPISCDGLHLHNINQEVITVIMLITQTHCPSLAFSSSWSVSWCLCWSLAPS